MRRVTPALWAGLLLLLVPVVAGSRTPDTEASPVLGLYGVESNSLADVAAAGFNVVHSYTFETGTFVAPADYSAAVTAYLDSAQAHGLRVLVGVPRAWILARDTVRMRAAVEALRHHPAIFAWYEEELGQQGHVDEVETLRDVIERSDPEHGLIIEENRRRSELLDVGRARMFTYYPISEATRKRKRIPSLANRFPTQKLRIPFFPVLQAYGQDMIAESPTNDLVMPTRQELQYCLYSAVVHDAAGVFFYTYRHPTRLDAKRRKAGKWAYTDYAVLPSVSPKGWDGVLGTLAEARFLLPRVAGCHRPVQPVRVSEGARVESGQWGNSSENVVVLANGRYESRSVILQVPSVYRSWSILRAGGPGPVQSIENGTVAVDVPGPGGVAVAFQR
jgi:hypothetical protein